MEADIKKLYQARWNGREETNFAVLMADIAFGL